MGRAQRDGRWWYYLDDGLYGSYSGQMFDHATYPIEALADAGPTYPSVLAGPTCDSIDVIREDIALPKLEQGDLVIGTDHGCLYLGIRLGIQFLSAPDGAGTRRRPADARRRWP
jgi:ornithine decarboxylase